MADGTGELKKLIELLKTKNEDITLIVTGGVARHFYDIPRVTVDIDAEIEISDEEFLNIISAIEQNKIIAHVDLNIDSWGMIPLPEGYKERAEFVFKDKNVTVKVMDKLDYLFSKLARGTEEDINDALEVIKKFNITSDDFEDRYKLIKLLKAIETFNFIKRVKWFKEQAFGIKQDNQNNNNLEQEDTFTKDLNERLNKKKGPKLG